MKIDFNTISKEEIKNIIESSKWTFAKTFAKYKPHEYLVAGKTISDEDWVMFDIFINQNPDRYSIILWNKERLYINMDWYRYWTDYDFRDWKKIIIINRTPREWYHEWQKPHFDESKAVKVSSINTKNK